MPYCETRELVQYLIRVSKENSSFLYFTLESNEGICFYSTLPFEKGAAQRELNIFTTPELMETTDLLFEHLQKTIPFEICEKITTTDSL